MLFIITFFIWMKPHCYLYIEEGVCQSCAIQIQEDRELN